MSLGFDEELANIDSYTLIAPTNKAFNRLDPMSWRRVKDDPTRLRKFISRHIINRMVLKCSIPERGIYGIGSRHGDQTEFTLNSRRRIIINKHARSVSDDTLAANGVMYKVDHVLPCSCEKFLRTKRGQYINTHRYRRYYY